MRLLEKILRHDFLTYQLLPASDWRRCMTGCLDRMHQWKCYKCDTLTHYGLYHSCSTAVNTPLEQPKVKVLRVEKGNTLLGNWME